MKYYYQHNAPSGGQFVRVERNKLNPLEGLVFVSIAYYIGVNGQEYAVVF